MTKTITMAFTEYLQSLQLAPKTIRRYSIDISLFLQWLDSEQISESSFHYNDLMAFIAQLTERNMGKRRISQQLGIIRHYCSYLISKKQRTDNPAAGVFIKGLNRSVPVNLLTTEEMDLLYQQYQIQLHVQQSSKIMLGLLIYQGLSVGELTRLRLHHFLIKDGKLIIKGTRDTNERKMHLQAHQIHPLQQYIKASKDKEGYLFTESRKQHVSPYNIRNRLQYMFYQLKELNPKVMSAKQIRMSVITNWLKKHSLRETQYLSGHKYVSSTARYQTTNLDDLQQALKDHHPEK
jgi:integrase/recombinase XerD